MDNPGDTDGTARKLEYQRPAWRLLGDDIGSLLDAYLLAERYRAWEAAHPGWSLDWWADFGYWEARRDLPGLRVVVCRYSLDDLDARVEEILAAEAGAEAEAAAVSGPGP